MDPRQYQRNLAALRCGLALTDAAQAATGQAFLESELSGLDPVIRLPLENYTYMRDIPIDTTGKGWITQQIARNVDFRGADSLGGGVGSQSNDIEVIEYNRNQDVWPVYPWEKRVRIPVVESLRMAQIGESPQALLDKGVRIAYSKTLDARTYLGYNGQYGLVNNPAVTSTILPATGTGATTTWATKTQANILADFNFMATTNWNASGNAPSAMPDRFLVPPIQWTYLTATMTASGNESILNYIKRSYIGSAFGVTPEIYPLPAWLDGQGVGGTQLVLAYKFDKDCLSLGLPMEIQRYGGPLSVVSGAFEVLYIANIGVVKINRPQTVGSYYGA
jgi:hypothetical protein